MNEKETFIAGVTKIDRHFNIKNYTHIRAFHGCRTDNIYSYLSEGIVSLDKSTMLKKTIRLLHDDYNDEDKIKRIFEILWNESADWNKRVWFSYTEEDLIERSGHYLIFGSELINGVAERVSSRNKLKMFGKPTVFCCDVPIQDITPNFSKDINLIIKSNDYRLCGFSIYGVLNPENIIEIHYPTKIFNPYSHTYHYENEN